MGKGLNILLDMPGRFSIMFILLMNAFAFSSFAITAAASGLAVAIPCTFGSRILLNLRKQLSKTDQMGDDTVPTLATMDFNAGREESEGHSLGAITTRAPESVIERQNEP